MRDYHYLAIMSLLVSGLSILFSQNFVFGGEMLVISLIVGGMVMYVRRVILKVRKDHAQKKQAV